MRIPTEHFTATPVFALSPISSSQSHQDQQQCRSPPPPGKPMEFSSLTVSGLMQLHQQQHSTGPRSLMPSGMPTREKKMSLPANAFNAFSLQSVGSAPNSPETSRKTSLNSDSNSSRKNSSDSSVEVQQMSTISGQSVQPLQSSSSSDHPVAKNQEEDAAVVLRSRASKYATLPRK